MRHGLSKQERICSLKAIEALLRHGRYITSGPLKCCYARRDIPGRTEGSTLPEEGINRMMVSVSKKSFKRAVKRNLMKRRIREAYRLQKELLPDGAVDMMFIHSSRELSDFAVISESMRQLLLTICAKTSTK